ncbi:hypothetical protein [Streptomyces sp. NPDC048436]|uniref:hypothetical protein n=1 Tax=Streptomyces sp. NPDC048436 TaxID=3365550 RepID=UPI00371A9B7C
MSEGRLEATEVQEQYAAKVAADLEANRKEQERIGAEVASLQEQLQVLENDHSLLVRVQQALTPTRATAAGTKKETSRQKAAPKSQQSTKKSGGARAKKSATAPTPAPKVPAARSADPTLVELVHGHLDQHNEPRSAAEITSALSQAYPERNIKTTVVRTTVEGLVAKGRAERTKQGSSVFYLSTNPSEQPASPQEHSNGQASPIG